MANAILPSLPLESPFSLSPKVSVDVLGFWERETVLLRQKIGGPIAILKV